MRTRTDKRARLSGRGPLPALVGVVVMATLAAACAPRVQQPDFASFGSGGQPGATASQSAGSAGGGAAQTGAVAAGPNAAAGPGAGSRAASSTDGGAGGESTNAAVPNGGPPILIGSVGTMSGLIGGQFAGSKAALEAWAALKNATGGIYGREVQLIEVDDGGDPGRHRAAVEDLVDRGVVAFVGDPAPLTFSAGLPLLEQHGIPAIGGDTGEKGWFTSPLAFGLNGTSIPQGNALGRYLGKTLPQTKLAIYHISEIDIGTKVADEMQKRWEEAGKQVVSRSSVSLAHPDFTAEVLDAKGKGADIVAIFADFSGCRRFWDAARRQDYKPVFVVASACYHPAINEANDMTANNVYAGLGLEPPHSSIPAMVEMRDTMARFAPQFSAERVVADGILPHGWASGKLFELAVEAAGGSTEPADLIAAMNSLNGTRVNGLTPPLDTRNAPHPQGVCGKVLLWTGSEWKTLTADYVC